jgi:micrococcal nuclease
MARTLRKLALPLLLLAIHPPPARAQDSEQAQFAPCGSGARITCVVDVNTPETSQPSCPAEAVLGARATRRLTDLLNQGSFSLEASGRDMDRYGRLLRMITRNGQSLGAVLVSEGLAEQWQGRRGNWCEQLALAG